MPALHIRHQVIMSQGLRYLHRQALQQLIHGPSPSWSQPSSWFMPGCSSLHSQMIMQLSTTAAACPHLQAANSSGVPSAPGSGHQSMQPPLVNSLQELSSLLLQSVSRPHMAMGSMISHTSSWRHQWGPSTFGLVHHSRFCSHQHHQHRGYRSLKKSLKPINTRASRLAVHPFLTPNTQHPLPAKQLEEQARLKAAPILDTVLPDIPKVPTVPEYRRIGRITGEYALQVQPVFGVVQLQGTQAKLTVDDILFVNHLPDVAVNDIIALDRVMLVGTRDSTTIGRPWVPQACVLAAVEEHFKDGIVHVFKFKKRNRYKRYKQYQHALTALRILHVMTDTSVEQAQVALQGHIPHIMFPQANDDEDDQGDSDDGEQVASKR